MHTRIFSERERRVLRAWLEGRPYDRGSIRRLLYNFRVFDEPPGDVELYLRVSRKAKPSKAAST